MFLNSLNIYDQHRDMRLDIDNMTYEVSRHFVKVLQYLVLHKQFLCNYGWLTIINDCQALMV